MAVITTPQDVAISKRFWPKVLTASGQGPDGTCWEWQAHKLPFGYGSFRMRGRIWKAHRAAFILTIGPIPDGLVVRHTCDNPPCCNPAHLLLGTHQDNSDDQVARGRSRSPRGEANANARLREDQVRAIRDDNRRHADIAEAYGVSKSAVQFIKCGKHWGWLV